MAKDPVCGMEVSKKGSPSTVHMGKTFYFKSEGCKSRFNEDPMKYMNN
ncbi:MAG: YHS domain-containing protein [Caldiserica bacterium]|nr:YHS domain-containing protein [Caldisericota bacterium]